MASILQKTRATQIVSDEDGIRQGDGDYLASLPLMKPFNFDASNLGAAVANERAKRDEDTERRLSMCVLPAGGVCI
jgi:hypothetical protein